MAKAARRTARKAKVIARTARKEAKVTTRSRSPIPTRRLFVSTEFQMLVKHKDPIWLPKNAAIVNVPLICYASFSCRACRGSSAPMCFLNRRAESLESAASCYFVQPEAAVPPLGRPYRSKCGCARLVGQQRAVGPQLHPFQMPDFSRWDLQRLLAPHRDLQASVAARLAQRGTGSGVYILPLQHALRQENSPLIAPHPNQSFRNSFSSTLILANGVTRVPDAHSS